MPTEPATLPGLFGPSRLVPAGQRAHYARSGGGRTSAIPGGDPTVLLHHREGAPLLLVMGPGGSAWQGRAVVARAGPRRDSDGRAIVSSGVVVGRAQHNVSYNHCWGEMTLVRPTKTETCLVAIPKLLVSTPQTVLIIDWFDWLSQMAAVDPSTLEKALQVSNTCSPAALSSTDPFNQGVGANLQSQS